MDNLPDAMTINEAAAFLKIHPRTVARLVRDRQLRFSKIGGSLRFSRRYLTEILDSGIDTNHKPRAVRKFVG